MKKTTSFFTKSTLSLGIVAVLSAFSLAEAPLSINYQGKLTNSSGEPTNVEVTVKFKFYNDPTLSGADHLLWSPAPIKVTPVNGVFSVPIPVNATLFSGTEVYLGVSVNEGAEMSPRQQLWAVPYALAVGKGSVGTSELANSSVTTDKLSDLLKIDADQINDGNLSMYVIASSVAVSAVDTAQIKNNAVTGAKIADGTINTADVGSISKSKISDLDLGTLASKDTVGSDDLANGAVTKDKLYGSDFIDVYMTQGDNRLVVFGSYKTGACKGAGASDDFYDCDGNCSRSSPDSCSAVSDASKVGRMLKLPE